MKMLLQLGVLSLCLGTAFPSRAQTSSSGSSIQLLFSLGSVRLFGPPLLATADAARRGDPVVFFDRITSGPSSEATFHLNVYESGLVSVSRAVFGSPGTSERADFDFVPKQDVAELRRALLAAGAPLLNGLLARSGILSSFSQTSNVTFFQPNRTLRAGPFIANSFSFESDVRDPRAARVAAVLEAFAAGHFPRLFPD
jgi:hypothetical protein